MKHNITAKFLLLALCITCSGLLIQVRHTGQCALCMRLYFNWWGQSLILPQFCLKSSKTQPAQTPHDHVTSFAMNQVTITSAKSSYLKS